MKFQVQFTEIFRQKGVPYLALYALIGMVLILVLDNASKATFLKNLGVIVELHSDSHGATRFLRQATVFSPSDPTLRWFLANSLYNSELYSEAYELFDFLIEDPRFADRAYNAALTSLLRSAGVEPAIRYYLSDRDLPSFIPSQLASTLAEHLLINNQLHQLDDYKRTFLLGSALGYQSDAPQLDLLVTRLADNLSENTIKKDLLKTLRWRSQNNRHLTSELSSYQTPLLLSDRNEPNFKEIDELARKSIVLGRQLIINGNFSENDPVNPDVPKMWRLSRMDTGNPWNRGTFIMGLDCLDISLDCSIRIDGLLVERDRDKQEARSGFEYLESITLLPGSSYLIRFRYKTEGDPKASLWIFRKTDVLFVGDQKLPSMDGNWCQVVITLENDTSDEYTTKPILRAFDTGIVWFDDFEIYEVLSPIGIGNAMYYSTLD